MPVHRLAALGPLPSSTPSEVPIVSARGCSPLNIHDDPRQPPQPRGLPSPTTLTPEGKSQSQGWVSRPSGPAPAGFSALSLAFPAHKAVGVLRLCTCVPCAWNPSLGQV